VDRGCTSEKPFGNYSGKKEREEADQYCSTWNNGVGVQRSTFGVQRQTIGNNRAGLPFMNRLCRTLNAKR
jgi:hypothetical protein